MTMKRVCLEPTDTKKYDSDYNIVVDLFLDREGKPSPKMPALGCMGPISKSDGEIYPFIIRSNGDIDFGAGYGQGEREFHLNLRGDGRSVMLGEFFTYNENGDEIVYRVTKTVDLA